ncbi:MAG: carboxypeptidase-like regulatory domain-containing protein [Coxiellaceae bacterium]|nr:carboxypeptidase-like regulatory domain-containing protein [Coxiellaceae bacterium]
MSAVTLLLTSYAFAATTQLENEDIALFIAQDLQSQFYAVKMNEHEQPYLNVENILQQWFGLRSHCDVAALRCTALIPPDGIPAILDGKNKQLIYGKTIQQLPPDALVQQEGKLWLSYTAMVRWLPLNAQWSLQQYRLQLIPQFVLPKEIQRRHDLAIKREKSLKRRQSELDHADIDKPKDRWSIESRYRFDAAFDENLHSQYGLSTETNLDIFKGTLYVNGNAGYDLPRSQTDRIYWNYSVTKPGQVHLLRVGHTETENTLLLPYLNLKRTIEFQRLQPAQGGGGGFQYVGRTMPASEVDVYRNGVLLTTQIAGSSGSYIINTPSAIQGDIFVIKIYHRDGTHTQKEIVIANDYGLILAHKNFDVQGVVGQIDQGDTPRYSHLAWRYGFFNDATLGFHFLELPNGVDTSAGAGMIDLAWRPKTWVDVIAETLRYNVDTDYSAQSNITYFKNHNIRLQVNHINDDSPLVFMRTLTPTVSLADNIINSDQSWSIEDIYNRNTWRFASKYTYDIAGNTISENITGNFNQQWSSTADAGYSWNRDDDVNNTFALLTLDYRMTSSQLIEISHAWQTDNVGQSFVMYRLQGNGDTLWDTNVGLLIPNHGQITFSGTLSYRAHRHWMVSATFDNSSINAVLSFQGLFGTGYRYRNYNDFGTGSIEGYVRAPSQDGKNKQGVPLEGVRVSVGDAYGTTDKEGHYFIAGVPIDRKVRVKVDTKTLTADYMLPNHVEVAELRPGTIIHYNPRIEWAGGIDGQILSDVAIPKDARVIAVDKHTGEQVAETTVEPDGFFVLDKLAVGEYDLVLQDENTQPQKIIKHVKIPTSSDWLSDVRMVANKAKTEVHHGLA